MSVLEVQHLYELVPMRQISTYYEHHHHITNSSSHHLQILHSYESLKLHEIISIISCLKYLLVHGRDDAYIS